MITKYILLDLEIRQIELTKWSEFQMKVNRNIFGFMLNLSENRLTKIQPNFLLAESTLLSMKGIIYFKISINVFL